MFSKSILAAAVLAGASAVTAYEHPDFRGHHRGPHPCKTTSTVVVYATETSTVYEAAGTGGSAAWGNNAGGHPTYGGGSTVAPATVTVTATVAAGADGGWGSGSTASGSSSSVDSGTDAGGKGGFGGGYGTGSTTASATSTSSSVASPSALCLTNATASYLTNGYGQLLSAYTNATAISLLAADFTDTSDSINWLAGIPLGGPTFASKGAFIGGQGTQPPIGFTVQSIMFSCTQVAFRWTATVGLKKFPAKGINMFTASNLNNSAAGWQIQTMYSEFDVGAWEVDIGRTCSPQGANIAGSA